jgi:hypothetical protein
MPRQQKQMMPELLAQDFADHEKGYPAYRFFLE